MSEQMSKHTCPSTCHKAHLVQHGRVPRHPVIASSDRVVVCGIVARTRARRGYLVDVHAVDAPSTNTLVLMLVILRRRLCWRQWLCRQGHFERARCFCSVLISGSRQQCPKASDHILLPGATAQYSSDTAGRDDGSCAYF